MKYYRLTAKRAKKLTNQKKLALDTEIDSILKRIESCIEKGEYGIDLVILTHSQVAQLTKLGYKLTSRTFYKDYPFHISWE